MCIRDSYYTIRLRNNKCFYENNADHLQHSEKIYPPFILLKKKFLHRTDNYFAAFRIKHSSRRFAIEKQKRNGIIEMITLSLK